MRSDFLRAVKEKQKTKQNKNNNKKKTTVKAFEFLWSVTRVFNLCRYRREADKKTLAFFNPTSFLSLLRA